MTEEKTLGKIAFEAFQENEGGFAWPWEAAASAVREKVIEECAAVLDFWEAEYQSMADQTGDFDTALKRKVTAEIMNVIGKEIRALKASAPRPNEDHLIHPHPRQDGQQCDHPVSGDAK